MILSHHLCQALRGSMCAHPSPWPPFPTVRCVLSATGWTALHPPWAWVQLLFIACVHLSTPFWRVPRRLTRGSSFVPILDWENTGENWLTHVQVFRVQPCKPKCSWGPGFLLASLGTSLCTWTARTCQKVMFRLQSSVHPSPTTWDRQLSSVPTPQFYNLNNRICSATTFQFLPDFSLVMSNKWIMTSETWISLSATLSHTSYFPLIILHFCASLQLSTSYYFYICQVHV